MNLIKFGNGDMIVTEGYHGGVPALYIEPAPVPGKISDSADGVLPKDVVSLDERAVVLTFSNPQSITVMIEQLKKLQSMVEPAMLTTDVATPIEALRTAHAAFVIYERMHLAKDPPDTVKAARNGQLAAMCEHALEQIVNAAMTMSETQPTWGARIAHTFGALGMGDFGGADGIDFDILRHANSELTEQFLAARLLSFDTKRPIGWKISGAGGLNELARKLDPSHPPPSTVMDEQRAEFRRIQEAGDEHYFPVAGAEIVP